MVVAYAKGEEMTLERSEPKDELRPAVRAFAEVMEACLRENDHKDGWGEEQCSIEYLERRLVIEFAEYMGEKACETGNHPERECIDIANFAMMLYHRHQRMGSRFEH